MSLLETVLACTLFFLLMTVAFSVFWPMVRASQGGTAQSDLSQMAALTLEVIAGDVEQSAAPGISSYPTCAPHVPLALSVHQVLGLGQEGATIWAPGVTVYFWDSSAQTLRSLRCPPVPSGIASAPTQTQPYRWSNADLQTLLTSGPSPMLLATDVQSWSVTGLSSNGLTPPLVLSLTLSRTTNNLVQTFSLSQAAAPRVHNAY